MHIHSDELVEFITPAAQATLGRLATAHPWAAGFALVCAVGGLMLGLVSGFIKPENLGTPRKRAGARLALRFGLAIKGSAADFKTLFTGAEEAVTPKEPDPLTVAAGSLPSAPPPRELVERAARLPGGYGYPPRTAAEAGPAEPQRLPPVVSGARPPSRKPVPREEPATVPPPPAPGLRAPTSLRRLPTPTSALTETQPLPSRPGSRRRHDTPASPLSAEDAIVTPPEVPRPRSGHHADSVRGRGRG